MNKEKIRVRMTFIDSILGGEPGDPEVHSRYVQTQIPDDMYTEEAFLRIHQVAVTHDAGMIAGKYERMDGFNLYQSRRMNRLASRIWVDKNDDNLVFCMSVNIKWFRRDILEAHQVRFENY